MQYGRVSHQETKMSLIRRPDFIPITVIKMNLAGLLCRKPKKSSRKTNVQTLTQKCSDLKSGMRVCEAPT